MHLTEDTVQRPPVFVNDPSSLSMSTIVSMEYSAKKASNINLTIFASDSTIFKGASFRYLPIESRSLVYPKSSGTSSLPFLKRSVSDQICASLFFSDSPWATVERMASFSFRVFSQGEEVIHFKEHSDRWLLIP